MDRPVPWLPARMPGVGHGVSETPPYEAEIIPCRFSRSLTDARLGPGSPSASLT